MLCSVLHIPRVLGAALLIGLGLATASSAADPVRILAWDFTGESNVTTSTAEVVDANLVNSSTLTRGSGAAASAGNNSFRTTGFQNNGISTSNTDYFQVVIAAATGYQVSLSTIDARFAGTSSFRASPGVSAQFAYSLDGTNFTLIGSPFALTADGAMPQINLSGVSELQSVQAGTVITIRYYASGQTTTGGWGFNSASSGLYGLDFSGIVETAGVVVDTNSYWDANGAVAGAGGTAPVGTWGTDTFWSNSSTGEAATVAWVAGGDAVFSAGDDATGAYTITLSGTQSAGSVKFEDGAVLLSGGVLELSDSSPLLNVLASSAEIQSDIGGTNGLSKSGVGTLILTGAKSFQGSVAVAAGTLQIAEDGALGAVDNDLVINGTLKMTDSISLPATRFLTGSGSLDIGAGDELEILGSVSMGALTLPGAGSVDFANATTSIGALTLGSSTTVTGVELTLTGITASYTTGTATIENTLAMGTTARTVTVSSATAVLDLPGAITLGGTASLTKAGPGTLKLSGVNTTLNRVSIGTQGATPADGGTVLINNKDALGAQQTFFNYGAIEASTALTDSNALPVGLSMGGRTATPVVLKGEDMVFSGNSGFFTSGSTGDVRLNVMNHTTFTGTLSSNASSAALTGFALGGDGTLTLSGIMTGFQTALKLKDTVTLELDTDAINLVSASVAELITLDAGTTLIIGQEGTTKLVTAHNGLNAAADSVVKFDITGTTRGTGYDALVLAKPAGAAGAVTFAGKVDVEFVGGFTPAAGQTFDLLDWDASATVNFTGVDFSLLPVLDSSLAWNTGNFSINGTLSIISTAITITDQPDSVSVQPGTQVTFSVVASAPGTMTYQWYKNEVIIPDATSDSYTIASVLESDQGNYTVVVTSGEDFVTSDIAVLDVIDPIVPVQITVPPQSQAVIAGQQVVFSVTATGTTPFTYQWRKGLQDIDGAESSTYTIASAQEADEGSYSVVVTGPGPDNTVTSSAATLTVLSDGDPVPLTGTSYSTDFNSIALSLPAGWSVKTGATVSTLGNAATFNVNAVDWGSSTGSFRNSASATTATGGENASAQSGITNRAVGLRQTGAFGDPGASFNFNFSSLGKTLTELSLKLQMLSVQTRSTTWSVQVGLGAAPEAWETLYTFDDPGVFGSTTVTLTEEQLVGLANQAHVWFRVVALGGSAGSGSRDTVAIDDFSLAYEDIDFGLYWDANGAVAGAGGPSPVGTWGVDTFWSTSLTGEAATAAWISGQAATFSAGEDALGSFTVTLSGAQSARIVTFEEGEITLSGSPLIMSGALPVIDAKAPLSIISSELQGTAGFRKIGSGTLRLTASNNITGNINLTSGKLEIASDAALGGTDNDLAVNGTLATTTSFVLASDRLITGSGTFEPATGTILTVAGSVNMTAMTLGGTGTLVLNGFSNTVGGMTIPVATKLEGNPIIATGIQFTAVDSITTIDNAIDFGFSTRVVNVPDVDSTLVLNGALTFTGTGNTSVSKFGEGTLELNGANPNLLRIQLGSQTTGPSTGGRVRVGNSLALGSANQMFFNYGTLEASIPLVGVDALPVGLSLNARVASPAILEGEAIEFTGATSFADFGLAGDVVLKVNNTTVLSGTLSGVTTSGVTGFAVGGTGTLRLSGDLTAFKMPLKLQDSVTLELEMGDLNSLADNNAAVHSVVTVSSGATLAISTVESTGTVTAYTSLDAQSGSTLHFNIDGTVRGSSEGGYDALNLVAATGAPTPAAAPSYTFAGKIMVEFDEGFVPEENQSFDLIDWDNSGTADFTNVTLELPDISASGLAWETGTFSTTGVITIVSNILAVEVTPESQTLNTGDTATFTATVSGPGTRNYQWQKGTVDLNGETGAQLVLTNVQSANAGSYRCIVSNGIDTVQSTYVTLAVVPSITGIVASRTPSTNPLYVGDSVTFRVTGGGSGLSYQWKKGNSDILGATSATYQIPAVAISDTADYSVMVSRGGPAVQSNVVPLTVLSPALVISANPTARTFVKVGEAFSLSVTATGRPPVNYQWLRDGVKIAGATKSVFSAPKAALTHGGTYQCVVTNPTTLETKTSASAQVGVVLVTTANVNLAAGSNAIFKAQATGPNLVFSWMREINAAPPNFSPSVDGKTYTGTGVNVDDYGIYTCTVGMAGVGYTITGSTYNLKVYDSPPDSPESDIMPDGIIGSTYYYEMPYTVSEPPREAPISFSAKGLPAGLKMDSKTGIITGRPTKASAIVGDTLVPFTVTMTAKNALGSTTTVGSLIIKPYPLNLAGSYVGFIERSELNGNLGGRLDLTITATGTYSGSLLMGATKLSVKGTLEVDPDTPDADDTLTTFSISVPRKGDPVPLEFEVSLPVDDASDRRLDGTLTDGVTTVDVEGWRNKWNVKAGILATAYEHYYTFRTELTDEDLMGLENIPQGSGYGSFKVTKDGKLKIAGATGDGQKLSVSGFVGPQGEIVFFQTLYTPVKGSIAGIMTIDDGVTEAASDNGLGGTLTLLRPANAKSRAYKDGFGPIELDILGGAYAPTLGNVALDLPAGSSAKVFFTEAGLTDEDTLTSAADITVQIQAKDKIVLTDPVPSPTLTKVTAKSATGLFSGSFSLVDTNPIAVKPPTLKRSVKFQGIIVKEATGYYGYGYFLLDQLPTIDPPTTTRTSPNLSGHVEFAPVTVIPPAS